MTTETTTPTPAAAPPAVPEVDPFDAAFDEIVKADEAPAVETSPVTAEVTPPAVPPPAVPPPVVETPPVTAEITPPVTPPSEPTELEKAQARVRELEAAQAKPPEPAVPEPAVPEPPPEPPKVEYYAPTADETALLGGFQKDWPDIAKAVELHNRISMENLARYIFNEVKRTYDPVLTDVTQRADAIESELVTGMLRRDHSDYDDVHAKVTEWVDTLPAFAKMGAQHVMKEGTPQQVSELIAEYKKTHPVAATPATTAAAPATKVTELSAAAKKAAVTLSVVDSKRTAATTAADPNDFDGAWKEISN